MLKSLAGTLLVFQLCKMFLAAYTKYFSSSRFLWNFLTRIFFQDNCKNYYWWTDFFRPPCKYHRMYYSKDMNWRYFPLVSIQFFLTKTLFNTNVPYKRFELFGQRWFWQFSVGFLRDFSVTTFGVFMVEFTSRIKQNLCSLVNLI